jgi:hypothetical protein
VKLAAAKLDVVFCLIAGKRVGISDDIGRCAAAQEIMYFQLGNDRSEIFSTKPGLFADFVQLRRLAQSSEKLKHSSPNAVLRGLESVIPPFGKTHP